ncbi:hypothetical protein QW180_17990 [Vibrio sinaloensis]|nr:hypothetical protein [Vibrio sinaloensis]
MEYIPTSIDLAELVNQEETFRQLASIHSADADQGFFCLNAINGQAKIPCERLTIYRCQVERIDTC